LSLFVQDVHASWRNSRKNDTNMSDFFLILFFAAPPPAHPPPTTPSLLVVVGHCNREPKKVRLLVLEIPHLFVSQSSPTCSFQRAPPHVRFAGIHTLVSLTRIRCALDSSSHLSGPKVKATAEKLKAQKKVTSELMTVLLSPGMSVK